MSTLAFSEDPDEMQHHAAFHQGLHCLLISKHPSGTDIHLYLNTKKFLCPLKVYNGQSHTNCINMYGKIRINTYRPFKSCMKCEQYQKKKYNLQFSKY